LPENHTLRKINKENSRQARSPDEAKRNPGGLFPHYAEFIIGPAERPTRWLHAGYEPFQLDAASPLLNQPERVSPLTIARPP
jgi:hypothetical protein